MQSGRARGSCFRCGQPGHFARDCREVVPSCALAPRCTNSGVASTSEGMQPLHQAPVTSAGGRSRNAFRRNVVAILFNSDEYVLACFRKDRKGLQFVQGGVEDDDTDVTSAAWREIDEEIGLRQEEHGVEFVGAVPPPNGDPRNLRYLFPRYAAPQLRSQGYIGQQQELLLFYAPTAVINSVRLVPTPEQVAASGAKQEFRRVEWMDMASFLTRCADAKRHIFEYVALTVPPMMQAYLALRATSTAKAIPADVATGDAAVVAAVCDGERKRERQQSLGCEHIGEAESAERRAIASAEVQSEP